MRYKLVCGLIVVCSGCVHPVDVVNSHSTDAIAPAISEPVMDEESVAIDAAEEFQIAEKHAEENEPKDVAVTQAESDSGPVAETSASDDSQSVENTEIATADTEPSSQPVAKEEVAKSETPEFPQANIPPPRRIPLKPAPELADSKAVEKPVPLPRDREEKKTLFQQLDENKDGKLSGSEIPKSLIVLISEIDQDGDRALTQREIQAYAARQNQLSKSDRVR